MSERNDEQRQALRLRRALIGMIGCLASVVLAWTAREFGLVALPATGFWLLFGSWAAGYAALVVLIHTGRNQGLKDPSCTVPQILWAALGALMLLLLAPELFALSWLALLVVGLFGAFRLSSRRYVTINLMIAGAATAAFVFNRVVWPGVGDTAAAALGYTAFLLALAVVTLVGLELSGYRRELVQRSEQFAQACDRLREMAIRDELTGLHNRRFLMDVL